MKFVTLDVESTGLDEQDQVLEIGLIMRDLNGLPYGSWSTLIRPTVPVNPAARANHHVTDKELKKAWTMEEMLHKRGLPELDGADTVLVGHNLEFDVRLLLQSGVPESTVPTQRICTMKCARHLFPEAPAYGNQVLRYYLGLKVAPSGPPHRALPDVEVTDALLEYMLRQNTPEQLIELTIKPVLQKYVRFGQHRDKLWKDVEISYLRWILDPKRQPPFDNDVRYTAEHHLRSKQNGNIKRSL